MARADSYCDNPTCKAPQPFPTSREVIEKKRKCAGCGKVLKVEKSLLYVVETLEEQVEWLSERLAVLEGAQGITARIKPQPTPPEQYVSAPERTEEKTVEPVDLFGLDDVPSTGTLTLADLL